MFEKFGRKAIAKLHEVIETPKAEESLTIDQQMLSEKREKLIKQLRETDIEVGEDLVYEVTVDDPYNPIVNIDELRADFEPRYQEPSRPLLHFHVAGTFDKKNMEFWYDVTLYRRGRTSKLGYLPHKFDNFRCIVDGIEVDSPELAEESIKKVWNAAGAAGDLLALNNSKN